MSEPRSFSIQITGEEKTVQELVKMLRHDAPYNTDSFAKITQLNIEDTNAPEISGNEKLSNVIMAGSCEDSLENVLKETGSDINIMAKTKELNLAIEAYAHDLASGVQEHMIVDRGQIVTYSQEKIREYDIDKLPEEELESLLFVEGCSDLEELMEMADSDGIFRVGGLEHYGEFAPLQLLLEQEPRQYFQYDSTYGGTYYVTLAMNRYAENDNLYLGMGYYDEDYGGLASFGDITVNVGELPYLESAIDTNDNGPAILGFLEENKLAVPTGEMLFSGYCMFPVYKFNPEKLKEIDPKQFEEYSKEHGVDLNKQKKSLDLQIRDAKMKTEEHTINIERPEREI